LWHWEEGDRGMGAARLQRIADALGMTATALLPELGDLSIDA
jgi:transcriptional regulator with XRE-family HTH domain